jgi:cobyrinic acid a,c-diamide synthase
MLVTKQIVADKIAAYLRHTVSLAEFVEWAERALMEAEFPEHDAATLSRVVARLGVADVRAFGLSWEDCKQLLGALGYTARVEVVAA